MELKDAVQDLVVAGMEALHPGTLTVFAQPCKAYLYIAYNCCFTVTVLLF